MGQRQSSSDRLVMAFKSTGLSAQRALRNRREALVRWPQVSTPFAGLRKEIRTPLYADPRPEERHYEQGKVENLRVAARILHGIEVPAGELFSFWQQLGKATSRRGFVEGRMLQGGCVVPALGGGLCQLSNGLYELALLSGADIVERHPHSHPLPGTPRHDATVAWNYIDLRFRPQARMRLEVQLTATELVTSFVTETAPSIPAALPILRPRTLGTTALETCATCAEVGCSRHEAPRLTLAGTTAFLLDAFTPEFDRYVQATRTPHDRLLLPIDGVRLRLPRYRWSTSGFASVESQAAQTLLRSWRSRRLAEQGAARQTESLRSSRRMAQRMAGQLTPGVSHVVVDQTLLPFLWQTGALGGRTFDVLMRRLPMHLLQARLDEVAQRWPQSPTAADFRADESLVECEAEALSRAARLITPHAELASLAPERTLLLDWVLPQSGRFALQQDDATPRILFAGPTAARKGAYLLRDACKGLPAELLWRGAQLEGETFWSALPGSRGFASLTSIAAVVQPAFLEDQPRLLLEAIRCGIPVLASHACGLNETPGVHLIPTGEEAPLRQALVQLLESRGASELMTNVISDC